MTGLRVSLLGAVALSILVAGAVALYASDEAPNAETVPYHVKKAMSLTVR